MCSIIDTHTHIYIYMHTHVKKEYHVINEYTVYVYNVYLYIIYIFVCVLYQYMCVFPLELIANHPVGPSDLAF